MLNKIKIIPVSIVLSLIALFVSGCATLTYSGEDYSPENMETVKTNEDFVFSAYKKNIDDINVKVGISKTSIAEILALYIQIENLSYNIPYVFKVEDLHVKNPSKEMQFITSQNYLNIWQTQEAASMSALSSVGSNFAALGAMNSNYGDINQTMVQNNANEANKSAYSKLDTVGSQIAKHSIKYSSTINPRKSQYFYFFMENEEEFPMQVFYKDLKWEFNL